MILKGSDMYNPTRYQDSNQDEIFELMDQYPFATVISVGPDGPVVSHLPITPKRVEGKIELIGHLARANLHWQSLEQGKTLVIFQGPHTYVTPMWYKKNNVPTWNYVTLHASGATQLIQDHEGLVDCLKELTNHVERNWHSGWEFYLPEDLGPVQLPKAIVGFRIQVEKFNFKKKLSQNRSEEDRAGVLEGLKLRRDENSRLVFDEMSKLYLADGKLR